MEQAILWLRVLFPEPSLPEEMKESLRVLYQEGGISERLQHLLIDLIGMIIEDSLEKRLMMNHTKVSKSLSSILVQCHDQLQFLIAPDIFLLYKNGQTTSFQHDEQELFLLSFLL